MVGKFTCRLNCEGGEGSGRSYEPIRIGRTGGKLEPRIKLSEQAAKISNPGIQQVRRWKRQGRMVADVIYDELTGCKTPCTMVDPLDPTRQRVLSPELVQEDLLVPVIRGASASGRRRASMRFASMELYTDRVRLIQQARRVHTERW